MNQRSTARLSVARYSTISERSGRRPTPLTRARKFYWVDPRLSLVGVRVAMTNQFGHELLRVKRVDLLCVPSAKFPLGRNGEPVR